jgi:hypothetical protein
VAGPGALVLDQQGAGQSISLNGNLGSALAPLAGLAINEAGTAIPLGLRPVFATGDVTIETAGDLTVPAATSISSTTGDIVLATSGNFFNNSGAGVFSAPSGRWLVYSTSPAGSTENGLAPSATRLYNQTFAGNPPAGITAGNHLLYGAQPALNVAADDATRPEGAPNPPFTFAAAGYVSDDGVTDTIADAAFAGALTSVASPASAPGPYAITQGTLASGGGYAITFTAGTLTVTAAPVVVVPPVVTATVDLDQAYLDALAGIDPSRIVAPLPVEYHQLYTIENGGMRLPQGLEPQ